MHPFSAVTQKGSVCGPMFIWTCLLVLVFGAHHQICPHISDSLCIHACNTFIHHILESDMCSETINEKHLPEDGCIQPKCHKHA